MSVTHGYAGATEVRIASPEEDPNAAVVEVSSPPCFLHELDPSYLGYLSRREVCDLLSALLAAEWFGTLLETAWLRAMLRRHLACLGHAPAATAPAAPCRKGGAALGDDPQQGLATRLAEALPRIADQALRGDLRELLIILQRDIRRRRDSRQPRRIA
jgi:hypothetical protein